MLRLLRIAAAVAVALAGTGAALAQQASHNVEGKPVVLPFTGIPADRFAATGDLDNTTDVSLKAARLGLKHCVTGVSVSTLATLGSDQTVRLLSNDTAIWQCALDGAATSGCAQDMLVPVCTVAGEALEIDTSADPTDNLIFYNVQGYSTAY